MRKQEESLQIAVSTYLKLQYPDVYFTSESSGIRVSIGTAVKMKKQRSNHKQLDMIILEPRGGFHGLILELKKDRGEVWDKNGYYRKDKHIQDQLNSILLLDKKNYYADFGCGFDECKYMIDCYMNLK
jgi:hypothetical protein